MPIDRRQRIAFVVAGSLTSVILELALAFDWGQELTGWSVAAVICATYAVKARFFDSSKTTRASHEKQQHG